MTVERNNAGKVLIANSGIIRPVIHSISILMKNENIPNDMRMRGKESSFSIGFNIILAAASTVPDIISDTNPPVNSTLLIRNADTRIAMELASAHIMNIILI